MRRIIRVGAAAIVGLLVLPGVASATVILDLSTLNGGSNFASGTTFSNPSNLGWDLTVSATAATVSVNGNGLGVVGGGSAAIDAGEGLLFDFDPFASLEGFTILLGANDSLVYIAAEVLGPGVVVNFTLPNAGGGGGNYTFDVLLEAESLSIIGLGPTGFRVGDIRFADPQTMAAPEPGTLALLGVGLLGLVSWRRKQAA